MSEASPERGPGSKSGDATIAPIFVVGACRSGTTLLRLMLNEHPDIGIPSESHFIAPLIRTFGPRSTLSATEIQRALTMVLDTPEWQRDFGHTEEELRAAVGEQPLALAEFIDRVFRLEVGSEPAHWGDKTPANLRWVPPLLECFPRAHAVAIVRDPRDVYLSLAPLGWFGDTPWAIGRYIAHNGQMLRERIASCPPDRLHVVRYEDLVLDAEATLRPLCARLGVDFVPAMVSFYENTEQNVQQWELEEVHEKLLRPPASDDVERWRREGSRLDRAEIESVTADVIDRWNYERSLAPFWSPLVRVEARARHHLKAPRALVTRNVEQLRRRAGERNKRRSGRGPAT